MVDLQTREDNMSTLINKVNWLKSNRIPNIQRERVAVDWLYKTNIKLAQFIHEPLFDHLLLWKFEDENRYIHMELVDTKKEGDENQEAQYWKKKVQERIEQRD